MPRVANDIRDQDRRDFRNLLIAPLRRQTSIERSSNHGQETCSMVDLTVAHVARKGRLSEPAPSAKVRFLALSARSWANIEGQLRVCAVKGGAFEWVQVPPGETLQPEATGAVMEVTKWLEPSV